MGILLLTGGVLTGCAPGRLYFPVLTFMPPHAPSPMAGVWGGGEAGKIPAQYPGEGGEGLGVSFGGVYLASFLRAEVEGSLWGGRYRYTDPAFSGTAPFMGLTGLTRASFLLPLGRLRIEAGLGVGSVGQSGVPQGVDLPRLWLAGGIHVGVGLPDRFWFRAAYGSVNTGIAFGIALSPNWWMGASAVRWWEDPRDSGIRLGVFRRWR